MSASSSPLHYCFIVLFFLPTCPPTFVGKYSKKKAWPSIKQAIKQRCTSNRKAMNQSLLLSADLWKKKNVNCTTIQH